MSVIERVRRRRGSSQRVWVDLCQCGHARVSHSARANTHCTVGQAGHCAGFVAATPQEIYARSATATSILLPAKHVRARPTFQLDRTA